MTNYLNNGWRHETITYTNREGKQVSIEGLIGPGYCDPIRENCVIRPAVPIPVKGPFMCHDNGHGTIHILAGERFERLVVCVSYYERDSDDAEEKKNRLKPEEALWLAQTIVEALNKAKE